MHVCHTEFFTPTGRCAEVEPDGAFELAISYKEGRGIEKDTSKAENWFRFAADLGHIGAQQVLGPSPSKINRIPNHSHVARV